MRKKIKQVSSKNYQLLLLAVISLTSFSCSTVLEVANAYSEPPSLEMVLERVNTSARALDLGDLILHGVPISAASTWPSQVSGNIPSGEYGKLMGSVLQEAIYNYDSGFNPSPVKIKIMYQQGLLFDEFPSMYYTRKFDDVNPSPETVRAYGKAVMGGTYNDGFYKSFYYFLKFTPAFRPKKKLFTEKLNGESVDYYPNIREAVISLAENKEALREALENIETVNEERKVQLRNIDEVMNEMKKLKIKERDAKYSEKPPIKKEIDERKGEVKLFRSDLNAINDRYRESIKIWKIELSSIREQTAEFDEQQRALAINIQRAIDAVYGLNVEATALVAVAILKFPQSTMNLSQELRNLARSPLARIRIERVIANSASLFDNAGIIRGELSLLGAEASSMNKLFKKRVKVKAL